MSDWFLRDSKGASIGPYPTPMVLGWVAAGKVKAEDPVCAVGGQQWRRIDEIPVLSLALVPKESRDSLVERRSHTMAIPALMDVELTTDEPPPSSSSRGR